MIPIESIPLPVKKETDLHREFAKGSAVILFGIIIVIWSVIGGIYIFNDRGSLDQPLDITACEPDSIDVNSAVTLSATGDVNSSFSQLDISSCVFVDPNEITIEDLTARGITVSGQVCSDITASWDVTVRWIPVDPVAISSPEDLELLRTVITWVEGCSVPYSVTWTPSDSAIEIMSAGLKEGANRWRVIGTASPVDFIDELNTYTWDSVKTFTLVEEQTNGKA